MSYQKGTIVRKQNGRFMLRYLVRCSDDPTRWVKRSELLEATTEKAAEKEKDQRMAAINSENQAAPSSSPDSLTPTTFQEFTDGPWQDYLDRKGIAQSTRRSYESNLNKYILPVIGPRSLAEIKPLEISELLKTTQQLMKGSKSLLNVYGQLHTMFAVAEDTDLIESNPVRKKVHRPNHEPEEKIVWSSDQVRAVLLNIPPVWYAFFLCLALTTVRISELLALTWNDIDWERRKITISKHLDGKTVIPKTKNKLKQVRHIPEALFDVLQRHRQISLFTGPYDFVFCNSQGLAADPDEIRGSVLSPAVDRAGIKRLPRQSGFHAFRHAGSTIIEEQTGDLKLSQIQLGHKRITTTANIYTHATMPLVERAGETLAAAILDTNETPK